MDDDQVVWPWGLGDGGGEGGGQPEPAGRGGWVFNPRGFLVAVLEDAESGEKAKAALIANGFGEADLRVYTGPRVLDDRGRFVAQHGVLRRAVGRLTRDSEAVDRFVGYAREGRCFVWVHVPDKHDANRAIRALSTHDVMHIRYYGEAGVDDIRTR